MFLKLVNLLYYIKVALTQVLHINENIIQVYNDKNNKLLSQDFIKVTLKAGWYIR